MSVETFLSKSKQRDWDRKVNLPDGSTGTFLRYERDIKQTYGKELHNYGAVIDIKPLDAYAVVGQDPLGNEVRVPMDKFHEVN